MTATEMVGFLAGSTGIEPATSGLTVQCANQAAPRARLETSAGYTTPSRNATIRITSKFRLPSRRSYIRSHGYPFRAEGGVRDATEPAGVRGAAARAVPERHARRERGT